MENQKEIEIVQHQITENQKNIEIAHEKINLSVSNDGEMGQPSGKLYYSFFLFVNPTSGGNQAAILTKLDVERMIFSTFNPKDADIELQIYSIVNKVSRLKGLKALKAEQKKGKHQVRVIVGGGDGTVLWVVEEMLKAGIDFNKCALGVIPFGTGNDFSRVLGWGGLAPSVLIGEHLGGLKKMMNKWVESLVEDFDIWDVTIETHDYGGIRQVFKEKGKKFIKRFMTSEHPETKQQIKITTLNKRMCNYFSFGIDSRIGYGFDKKRTHSRFKNKLVYFCEGIKKAFLKTPKVNDVLEVVHQEPTALEQTESLHDPAAQQVEQVIGENFTLYPSKGSQMTQAAAGNGTGTAPSSHSLIKGNHAVFLCLNIPSYMGGASDPWHKSKGKVGVTDHAKSSLPDFDDQKFGDGKLELIGFMGPVALAMERVFPGQGWRLGQVKGPFVVNFKQSPDETKPVHTYMQVDGEFFDVIAPKCVRVSLSKDLPNGKIKVMMNPEFHKQKK